MSTINQHAAISFQVAFTSGQAQEAFGLLLRIGVLVQRPTVLL